MAGYIAYHSGTEFVLQIGKDKKSSYTKLGSVFGDYQLALRLYNLINPPKGGKKRLLMPSSPKPVLRRDYND